MRRLHLTALVASLILLISCPITQSEPLFVDLNGDGFDDYLADDDNNGIPEFNDNSPIDSTNNIGAPKGEVIALDVFAGLVFESRTERFDRRDFTVRLLSGCRSDFDASFGGGLGVSMGSAGGGACAGGVCRPQRNLW